MGRLPRVVAAASTRGYTMAILSGCLRQSRFVLACFAVAVVASLRETFSATDKTYTPDHSPQNTRRPQFSQAVSVSAALALSTVCEVSFMWQPPQAPPWIGTMATSFLLFKIRR
jgi:hypothetical protein